MIFIFSNESETVCDSVNFLSLNKAFLFLSMTYRFNIGPIAH